MQVLNNRRVFFYGTRLLPFCQVSVHKLAVAIAALRAAITALHRQHNGAAYFA
ncbi:hypothetical protein SPSYN_02529 [Sporotomaculum syntrophicum]|uniref:Uncharacterized protein n=1 Tax=Sporotomaculum syntrophicum TaxID=182264 RepID=A0A9D2WP33_9FIRM|nr:hypothetical protein SPSYN_02529 [Sporotomaculum syntrophicum]